MEKHQSQNNTENDVENIIEGQSAKQSSSSTESPASASSSPSHEFSFSVSLFSSSSSASNPIHKSSTSANSFAIDLSPADDIFFHGHLLPLHFLSHISTSPRSSTNSMDSFTLPITESNQHDTPIKEDLYGSNMALDNTGKNGGTKEDEEEEGTSKSKSFSLFRIRGRKGCEVRDKEDVEKQKKKQKFHVVHVLKKYLRMVSSFGGKRERIGVRGQSYSYSEHLSFRNNNKSELRGRRGEYSAPASIRTSPTNSGLLLPTMTIPPASDSTMEELQAAIQAAIAHCKNSIAKEDKLKC